MRLILAQEGCYVDVLVHGYIVPERIGTLDESFKNVV